MTTHHTVYEGNNLTALKSLAANSVDYVCTDPPYAMVAGPYKGDGKHKRGFLGHEWDNSLPSIETLQQILRVLKPGGFATFFCATRYDLQVAFGSNIQKAGFLTTFSPLYWCYATGQFQATNMAKAIDNRLGLQGELLEVRKSIKRKENRNSGGYNNPDRKEFEVRGLVSEEAIAFQGAFASFTPKPAVEVIIVAMKPLSEKTYTDQAINDSKGISWLMRHPMLSRTVSLVPGQKGAVQFDTTDRTPSNIITSDMALGKDFDFFNLDRWFHLSFKESLPEDARTRYPFFYVPKPSEKERLPENPHTTVKPIQLISYLVSIFSSPGDTILDPYAGSGTTLMTCAATERSCITMEMTPEYIDFIKHRLDHHGITVDFIENESLLLRNNRPQKGASLTVDAIETWEDVDKIARKLSQNPRNRALFLLGIYSGIKATFLLKMTVGDAKHYISLPETTKKLKDALKAAVKGLEDGEIIFQSKKGSKSMTIQHLNAMVKNWTKAAGLEGRYGARTLEKSFRHLVK